MKQFRRQIVFRRIKLTATIVAFFLQAPFAGAAVPPWSSEAHFTLLEKAFPDETGDCLSQMKGGSEWVDGLPNQIPSKSYLHAMRSGEDQSVAEAKSLMANFIRSYYEQAVALKDSSTKRVTITPIDPFAHFAADGTMITSENDYRSYCRYRGIALHPVMDSTSPAHAGFAIWSLTDLSNILEHGDLPASIENLSSLLRDDNLLNKTVGLMRVIDILYLQLRQEDFLWNY